MNGLTVIYLISNAFCTVDIYLLYESFLGRIKRRSMMLVFLLYFVVVSGEYLVFGIPIITLILNIVGFLGLSLCYTTTWRMRIACVFFCYALYVLAEAIVMGVTGYFVFSYISRTEYKSLVGMACLPIIFFVIVMIVRYFRSIRKREGTVPVVYWIVVLLVPLSSMTVTMVIHTIQGIGLWQLIIVESIMFVITVGVFYLYVKQMSVYENEKNHAVAERLLEAYKRQLDAIQESERQTASLRHDMKNHLLAIRELAATNKDDGVIEYVNTMSESIPSVGIVFTGNLAVDAIINTKIYEGKNRNIQIETEIRIAYDIKLSNYELTVLLGNIMDNIIENAVEKAYIYIRSDKGRIIIKSSNRYENKRGNDISTDNHEISPKEYGTGLKNVSVIVDAHGGEMRIYAKKGTYNVELMLYM